MGELDRSELLRLEGVQQQLDRAVASGLQKSFPFLAAHASHVGQEIARITQGSVLGMDDRERDKAKAQTNVSVIAAVRLEEVERVQAEMAIITRDGRIEGIGEYKKLGAMLGNDDYWEYLQSNEEEMRKVGNAFLDPIVEDAWVEVKAEIKEEAYAAVEAEETARVESEVRAQAEILAEQKGLEGEHRKEFVERTFAQRAPQRVEQEVPQAVAQKAPVREREILDIEGHKRCMVKSEEKIGEVVRDAKYSPEVKGRIDEAIVKPFLGQRVERELSEDLGQAYDAPSSELNSNTAIPAQGEGGPNKAIDDLITSANSIGDAEEIVEAAEEVLASRVAKEEVIDDSAVVVGARSEEQILAQNENRLAEEVLRNTVMDYAAEEGYDNYNDRGEEIDETLAKVEADLFAALMSEETANSLQNSGMAAVQEESVEAGSSQISAVAAAEPLKDAEVEADIEAPRPTDAAIADAALAAKDNSARSV